MVDKVAVMYGGTIVEYGDKESVLNNPKHPYTKALINAIPKLDGKLPVGIKGNPPSFTNKQKGCLFAPRCEYASENCKYEEQKLTSIGNDRFIACTYMEERENMHHG